MKTQKHSNSNRRQALVKWGVRLLAVAAVAVLYFFVFAFLFDTPIEYEIKRSTRRLDAQYAEMSRRYDSLQVVLDNVVERDKSVYHILFEAEPRLRDERDRQARADLVRDLQTKNNRDLSRYFDSGLDQLYRDISAYNSKARTLHDSIQSNPSRALRIPGIQPVANRQLNLLTSSFGESIHPFFKIMHMHNGVDYSVPMGTAVFATADGVVEKMQTSLQTSGLSLTLDHGNGYKTVYGNLQNVTVPPGQRINRGDIIAFSGNSGLSFAPHLHYEIIYKGKPVDPLDYFFMELDMEQMERLREIASMGMQSFD